MEGKNLTGKYFWKKRIIGGFDLWVEIRVSDYGIPPFIKKYVKGNLADMNELEIPMNHKK